METETEVRIGDAVEYVDEYGHPHMALVTQNWGQGTQRPSINLLWISGDSSKTDQYGRQVERNTSVVHEDNQSAHGRYWRFLKD